MKSMTSKDIHRAIREALDEVSRRLATGELDGSGRYYTDEELAAGAVTDRKPTAAKPGKSRAA